jgi:hypothetical protein
VYIAAKGWPSASAAVKPLIRSAPLFQLVILPSASSM